MNPGLLSKRAPPWGGALVVTLLAACGLPRGRPVEVGPGPEAEPRERARSMASEPDGPRILYEGGAGWSAECVDWLGDWGRLPQMWLLPDFEDYERYWGCAVSHDPAPWIDMTRYVLVLDIYFGGFMEPPPMAGVAVLEDGLVQIIHAPRFSYPGANLDVAFERSRILALPRKILPDPFYLERHRKRFELSVPSPSDSGPPPPPLERDQIERPLGYVRLPEPGQVSLQTIAPVDGSAPRPTAPRVWVVHLEDGSVSVLASEAHSPDTFGDEPHEPRYHRGTFCEWWDSQGRPFWGGPPMRGHPFRRLDDGRLELGPAVPVPLGPVLLPNEDAPVLVPESRPAAAP